VRKKYNLQKFKTHRVEKKEFSASFRASFFGKKNAGPQ
jgi:hypothetical protein